jgi:DNA-binding IclR family transcriptional regulator
MRIQSIDRAISVLNLFKNSPRALSLAEITDSLGLVKTTVHTIAKTLEENGFLLKDPATRRYQLGFALLELGTIQAANLEINQRAAPHLQRLANEAGQVCRVGIWDSESVIITMALQPQGTNSQARQLGPRVPGYCTALGKAILANLPPSAILEYLEKVELRPYTPQTIISSEGLEEELKITRERGYSISNKEILPHQSGIGAPVRNASGQVAGAISMRQNPEDLKSDILEINAGRILRAAYEISVDLGWDSLRTAGTSK